MPSLPKKTKAVLNPANWLTSPCSHKIFLDSRSRPAEGRISAHDGGWENCLRCQSGWGSLGPGGTGQITFPEPG